MPDKVLYYRSTEGGHAWVAHHLDWDLVGTGATIPEALEEMREGYMCQDEALKELGDKAAPQVAAPEMYRRAWDVAIALPGMIMDWQPRLFDSTIPLGAKGASIKPPTTMLELVCDSTHWCEFPATRIATHCRRCPRFAECAAHVLDALPVKREHSVMSEPCKVPMQEGECDCGAGEWNAIVESFLNGKEAK